MNKLHRSTWGLDLAREGVDWRQFAACSPETAELFFVRDNHHPGRGGITKDNKRALQMCASCPVRRPCYDDAAKAPSPTAHIAGGAVWRGNNNVSGVARARAVVA